MTRVDFYILQQDTDDARMLFVCRLVDKAHRQGHRILIHAGNRTTAEALDDLLWSFRPESFIPHALADAEEAAEVPVVITAGEDKAEHHDLLINLASEIPAFFSRFRRLAEIAVQLEPLLTTTRDHYAFLKQRGYPIQTHKLTG